MYGDITPAQLCSVEPASVVPPSVTERNKELYKKELAGLLEDEQDSSYHSDHPKDAAHLKRCWRKYKLYTQLLNKQMFKFFWITGSHLEYDQVWGRDL